MPSPATTTPPAETGFDPLVFWIQHKTKIVLLTTLGVICLGSWGLWALVQNKSNQAAQELFRKADSADAYRKVISEYPGSEVAASSYLMLAQKLREEGKFDESTKELQSFIAKYPEHQFISGAWTSIAANQEAQGKTDEALATYQKVSTAYANSFSAPAALLAQARIMAAKGKTEDARRLYEQVMNQFRENFAAQQAAQEIRRLKK
jgi:TolA-binding protein